MPDLDNSSPRLFTVIMDFEGTTSASQFKTISVDLAVRLWAERLNRPGSYGLTDSQRSRLAQGLIDDAQLGLEPSLLNGLQNIWCVAIAAQGQGLALLNIVETVSTPMA